MNMKLNSLLLSLFALTVVWASPVYSKNKDLLDPKNLDRLLLVGFTDYTINSLKSTASPTSYRNRANAYTSSSWSERTSNSIAKEYGLEKMSEWPMTEVGVHCVVFRVADKLNVSDVKTRLSKDDRVEIVQNMHLFKTKTDKQNDPYFKLQTNLQQMQVGLAHSKATGKNITIGLIDTGVDIDHADLKGQITENVNLAESISSTFATDMHGTAVAGVMVAKKDNAKGIIGVAPDSKIMAWKSCWPDKPDTIDASCNSYTLALAVNNAIKANVNILNMSLTGPEDPILRLLLNKALQKGIVVVAANTTTGDNFPSSLKGVISVASTQHTKKEISRDGYALSAPGEKVLTTLPHDTYDFISGSSIAAAEVSGIVALLLELKPDLKAEDVQTILEQSKLVSKGQTVSGVDANLALINLCKTASCPEQTASITDAIALNANFPQFDFGKK